MPVNAESDLNALIPGDRVGVRQLNVKRWMTYKNICQYGAKITPEDRIFLIESPVNYNKNENPIFYVWTSEIRYLQFDQGIYMPSLHTALLIADPTKPESVPNARYPEVKNLVDLLE